jgi:hypothetical protein
MRREVVGGLARTPSKEDVEHAKDKGSVSRAGNDEQSDVCGGEQRAGQAECVGLARTSTRSG